MSDEEDFSKAPMSIAELRSDRTRRASDWTPRDALISVLRKIDSGEIKPTAVVIAYGIERDGLLDTAYATSGPNLPVAVGLLEICKNNLLRNAKVE